MNPGASGIFLFLLPYLHWVSTSDVLIVGAGLAGLCASLELRKQGVSVTLIERHGFPRHKVCGEYLSWEVVPYLKSLGLGLDDAPVIRNFALCDRRGKSICRPLPLGGIGISRYALDLRLYERAQKAGVHFVFEKALEARGTEKGARVGTTSGTQEGKVLLGAWGKRSLLDRESGRAFWTRESPWMAVKMHYRHADFPRDQVGLYFLRGDMQDAPLPKPATLISASSSERIAFAILRTPWRHVGAFSKRTLVLRRFSGMPSRSSKSP